MRVHPAGKLGEGATAVTGAELCERLFQSTPPARGATIQAMLYLPVYGDFNPRPPRGGRPPIKTKRKRMMIHISIHAPREGGDGDDWADAST